mmetsp:Transcript_4561/g.11016  ORF Transcript_4561/g.11016 Transcript_4561/m.11016 type:complete len:347 (-) Transcript_4561:113-1153(-)
MAERSHPHKPDLYDGFYAELLLGIGLEICAAALGTISKQLIATSSRLNKRWVFQLGAFLNLVVGPIVDASAYSFAPSVIIAPFSCLDVIFNALSAPYTLRWQNERLTAAHGCGTLLVFAGASLTALFGTIKQDTALDVYRLEETLRRPPAVLYMLAELFAVAVMAISLQGRQIPAKLRGPALGVLAGVLVGNVFLIKGFTGLVRYSMQASSIEAWIRPTPYILIAAAVAGALCGQIFLRRGLAEYKGVFMVTIFEGAHVIAACLSGSIVMRELVGLKWTSFVGYWLSVSLIVLGIVAINRNAGEAQLHGASSFLSSPSLLDTTDGIEEDLEGNESGPSCTAAPSAS